MEIWLGWTSSMILLATLAGQVWQEWRSESVRGVSPWLFLGQISASVGFVSYSTLIGNTVFIVTNCLILATALVGQAIYHHRKKQ